MPDSHSCLDENDDRRRATAVSMFSCLGAIVVLGCAFLALASAVVKGDGRGLDRAILLALRVPSRPGTPLGPFWLRESASDLSSLGSPTVLWGIVLFAFGYLLTIGRARLAAMTLATIGTGFGAATLCKHWFDRARPEVVPHLVPAYTLSFPSGHAADSAMVYLTLAMLVLPTQTRGSPRAFLVASAVALTLAIGLTRAYLGVHWPSDILAGWIFGCAWALIGHVVTTLLKTTAPDAS